MEKMAIRDWDSLKYSLESPETKAGGVAVFGFISVDELTKHAILSWIIEGLEEPFGKARLLTLIQSHPVAVYALLVVLLVAWVLYHSKQPRPQTDESERRVTERSMAFQSSSSTGTNSAALTAHTLHVKGNLVVGGAAHNVTSSITKALNDKLPTLIFLRTRLMECDFPYPDTYEWKNDYHECYVLPIRNDAITAFGRARSVLAHLTYYCASRANSVEVDDGWWREDGLTMGGFHNINIERGHTAYLVLARIDNVDKSLYTCPKITDAHRHRVGVGEQLQVGEWQITIELSGEGFRKPIYLTGKLAAPDSVVEWSEPMSTPPPGWRLPKALQSPE